MDVGLELMRFLNIIAVVCKKTGMTLEEVGEALAKLQSKPGVLGTLVATAEGEVLKTSLGPKMIDQVKGKVLKHLGKRGQSGGGGEGDGSFLRLCSGGLQYIGVREGCFLLVAVTENKSTGGGSRDGGKS